MTKIEITLKDSGWVRGENDPNPTKTIEEKLAELTEEEQNEWIQQGSTRTKQYYRLLILSRLKK